MSNRSRFRALVPRAIAIGLGILLAEGLLQIARLAIPAVDVATRPAWTIEPLLRDERGGRRGNPLYFEHDANGFRNAEVPDHADVVTLGDSQTYGVNVPPDANWPSALARLSGKTVYNMSLSGFGAAHCEALLDGALALHPQWVVFALYFGNDLYDDFEFARRNGLLAQYASPEQLARIQELESRQTIAEEVGDLFRSGQARPEAEPVATARGPKGWISDHSRLYGLLRTLKASFGGNRPTSSLLQADFDDAVAAITDAQRRFVSVFDGDWRTILTAPYRLKVEDDSDPRIAVGRDVSRRSIASMHERIEAAGARLALVLIPTKEFVFWPRVGHPELHPGLAELVAHEESIRERILADARERGTTVVDLAPALRSATTQPYFVNADGHPNPQGHELIAKTIFARIDPR